jgi:choline kinase
MKCLIIAAGQGTRLRGVGDSKPLVELLGKPLIVRVIETVQKAEVTDFYVVTGYKSEKVEAALSQYAQKKGVSITFIYNEEWEKQNGLSVLRGRDFITGPFFLLMSDHMFDPAILVKLQEFGQADRNHAVVLAVDTRISDNPLVDIDDVTRVEAKNSDIISIGKTLENYNAFDTGVFYCTTPLFAALEKSAARGDSSLSGGMRLLAAEGKAGVMDIGNRFWIDVDNEEMLKKAQELLEKESK